MKKKKPWKRFGLFLLIGVFVLFAFLFFVNEQELDLEEKLQLQKENPFEEENTTPSSESSSSSSQYPKIYVTIVMHSEQPTIGQSQSSQSYYPDYSSSEETFTQAREGLLALIKMLREEEVKFDFQSDSNFLEAIKLYDEGTSQTNGENIAKYLIDQGFDIDPHHHPSNSYSYADIAYLNEELTGGSTGVVGGFLYYPLEDSEFNEVTKTILGETYQISWTPTLLWGGGIAAHASIGEVTDTQVSGIWRPKSAQDYFTDQEGNLPYVGGYTNDAEGVLDLLEKANAKQLDPEKMYTANIMNNQRDIDQGEYQEYINGLQEDIQEIKAKDTNNLIVWVTITEAGEIWQEEYDSIPNIYYAEGFEGF